MFGMLYIAAVLAGLLLLIMTPLVYRFRDEPPPREVTWIAIVIGALPLVAGLAILLIGLT
jgi:hypothetical protein